MGNRTTHPDGADHGAIHSKHDFAAFFRAAYRRNHDPGFQPFDYQQQLATGRFGPNEDQSWPDLLEVPTGLGKTAAVTLAWLWKRGWRQGERASAPDPDTPRRLVWCLPMRVLVEQTHNNVETWLRSLGILGKPGEGKISVHLLMGGSEDVEKATWAEHPEEDMILIGTQDMLLSAALNRAYGTYPSRWPVPFGLLNVDTFWVMDEVQLMGPGRTTSVQLQHFFEQLGKGARTEVPHPRRTLWISATLGQAHTDMPDWAKTPEVAEANRSFARYSPQDKELDATRLNAPKSVRHEQSWTSTSAELHAAIIQEACKGDQQLALVFVNTVRRARELHQALKEKINGDLGYTSGSTPPEVILIHSRFRKKDRDEIVNKLNQGSGRRIVVSTQVLEAGVDLDADALFTEVAPWASLIQRFGRLNRKGEKPSAQAVEQGKAQPALAVVFELPQKESEQKAKRSKGGSTQQEIDVTPYEAEQIQDVRERLEEILNRYQGNLSPATLRQVPAPLALEGPVLREFMLTDYLFPTDADLSGGHTDVALYLRALDRDVDCYVLWRALPSNQSANGLAADEQPPIHRDELCPAPFFEAQEAFKDKPVWILAYSLEGRKRTTTWRRAFASEIKPGDTVMVPLEYGGYSKDSGWRGKDHVNVRPVSWIGLGQNNQGKSARGWKDQHGNFESIDHAVDPEYGLGGDTRSFWKRKQRNWMTLGDHLSSARREAEQLVQDLGLQGMAKDCVVEADLWHDLGKALERETDRKITLPFQEMLVDQGLKDPPHPQAGVLYAKSKPGGSNKSRSDGHTKDIDRFRHEVASALAYLMQAGSPGANNNILQTSLVAYLIIAHHGKVRCMPAPWDEERSDDWNGVRPGDRIAQVSVPNTNLQWTNRNELDRELFLSKPGQPGWQGRVALLLEHYGPFHLAYLEALVRIADWRAS